MDGPSITDPRFEPRDTRPGFEARRAMVGRQAGAQELGASLWELGPGETAYPYHFHFTHEELLIVLEGRPSLRTPEGWRELQTGEVVAFRTGEAGAHQVANHGEERTRFLAVSTMQADMVVYPDSDKIGVHGSAEGLSLRKLFRAGDDVDYYEGETPPTPPDRPG